MPGRTSYWWQRAGASPKTSRMIAAHSPPWGDAAAVQAAGEQVADLVRDRVAQEIRGIALEQAAVEADDVAVGVRHRGRHAAQVEGEAGALEAALEMGFGAAVARLDGGLQQRLGGRRRAVIPAGVGGKQIQRARHPVRLHNKCIMRICSVSVQ